MLTKIIYFISNHHRIISICIVLLFLAALGVILTELTVDNSIKIRYSEDDEQYQAFIDFQEKYGNDDVDIVKGSRANNQFFHYRNKTGFMHYTFKNLAK